MAVFYVHTDPPTDGRDAPDVARHETAEAALADVARRIGRTPIARPDRVPAGASRPRGVPADAVPLGAWDADRAGRGAILWWVPDAPNLEGGDPGARPREWWEDG